MPEDSRRSLAIILATIGTLLVIVAGAFLFRDVHLASEARWLSRNLGIFGDLIGMTLIGVGGFLGPPALWTGLYFSFARLLKVDDCDAPWDWRRKSR